MTMSEFGGWGFLERPSFFIQRVVGLKLVRSGSIWLVAMTHSLVCSGMGLLGKTRMRSGMTCDHRSEDLHVASATSLHCLY